MNILIYGIGFMGGSLASALTNVGNNVFLFDKTIDNCYKAEALGYGKTISNINDTKNCHIAIICTPVETITDIAVNLLTIHPNIIVTDIGSVKHKICNELKDYNNFVGSHPMCGGHHQSIDFSNGELFKNKTCVITNDNSSNVTLQIIETMWKSIGCNVLKMSSETHDFLTAKASHIPHIMAYLTASKIIDESIKISSSGFDDTTRIAASNPDLWANILIQNKNFVSSELKELINDMQNIIDTLSNNNVDKLKQILKIGNEKRKLFDER